MKNEKRDFPMKKEFLSNKKMNDIIYGFLQTNSYLTPEKKRFCWKSDVSASKIIKYFEEQETESPIAERTIRDLLKLFTKANLLEEGILDNKKVYFLPDPSKEDGYVEIKTDTLRFLVNTANSNVIKVYAQLKKMWECHVKYKYEEKYRFSKTDLLTILGYKTMSYGANYKMIEDILTCLQNNELIKVHKEGVLTSTGQLTEYYILDEVKENYKKSIPTRARIDDSVFSIPVTADYDTHSFLF